MGNENPFSGSRGNLKLQVHTSYLELKTLSHFRFFFVTPCKKISDILVLFSFIHELEL